MAAFDGRMLDFRPTKASPPPRPPRHVNQRSPTDLSFRSEQQLKNLSAEEVDFLDAVFQRAGPTAVGFMAVFDAYNRVLEERGLAQDEVVGYAKLLKVGNWRGETWREKWAEVKNKFGYNASTHEHVKNPRIPQKVHVQAERAAAFLNVDDTGDDVPQYHNTPRIPFQKSPCTSEATGEANALLRHFRPTRHLPPVLVSRPMSEITSVASEDCRAPSTTPPSYRTTEKETVHPLPNNSGLARSNQGTIIKPKAPVDASAARKAVAAAREKKGSVVNEDEAWKKIQIERDEKEATRFYQDRLVERCWYMWKNGYQWTIVTSSQIDEARDSLVLRVALQRWRKRLASRQILHDATVQTFNGKRLRRLFDIWTTRLKSKRQEKWRQGMRMKLKTIRDKRELRLQKDTWGKWQRMYQLHLASHMYKGRLAAAFFNRWKSRLARIDALEMSAEEGVRRGLQRLVEQKWTRWKHALELSFAEKVFMERTNLKVIKSSMVAWRKRTTDFQAAEAFYTLALMKDSLNSWKAARDRLNRMNKKADKQMARKDNLLLRAVVRVWKAQERGKLLERVIQLRHLSNSFTYWHRRQQEQGHREGLAVSFEKRPQSSLLIIAVQKWHQRYAERKEAHIYATIYHSAQLLDHSLLTWRIRLREMLKSAKLARIADKFFTTRHAWRRWRFHMEEKRRETALKGYQAAQLKEWAKRAKQVRTRKISEQIVQHMICKRLLRRALSRWTTAVIELKLRELEVSQQNNLSIQAMAFKRWKTLCIRHAEELSLMESYRYVKREECLRKFFNRWLAATRTTRRRRITLREREEDFRSISIVRAWDKWRDRFVEEKLRFAEHDFVLQSRRNLLFRAFGLWHSRTKSLPALRFRAIQLKSRYFGIWCSALPGALQAKKARELYQETILAKFMKMWVDKYRAKVALKAVARARYLRLPTAIPRLNGGVARTSSPSQPPVRADSPDDDPHPSISTLLSKQSSYKTNIVGLLRARARPCVSPTRSSTSSRQQREASPTRSSMSIATKSGQEVFSSRTSEIAKVGEERRGRLWLELRDVQRRTKTSMLKDET